MPSPLTLTALTSITLVFNSANQVLPDWHLPALRFVKLFQVYEPAVPAITPFFERHGPAIIGLQFRSWGRVASVPIILSYTTALQSVTLDESDLDALENTQLSFPSITHIGVHTIVQHATEESYGIEAITKSFKTLFANRVLPGLKMVRLVVVEKEAALEEKWGDLLILCRNHKVTLANA